MSTVELYTEKAPSVDLTVYRKEIYNFLKTATVKYDPLVEGCNAAVERAGGTVDESDPSTWKYYKNIVGEYHPIDTPMYVVSFDTQQKMLFSKENLLASPRTRDAYSVGNSYYEELCQLNPTQTDLIKGIRYPVDDWKTAYDADNLTYLKGDESLFEVNERDTLIEQLNKTLAFISYRWDFPGTDIEPLYPWVFWAEIWHILAMALFAQRFDNIRHSSVHSWNVWQYITSQGLSDYSDLLTFSQSMFLYRNLNYLNVNRGKQSNLIILANNLLNEWGLTLYGRDVIQRTDTGAKDALLYPDLIAKIIQTNNASQTPPPSSTVEDMIYKLINVGDELSPDVYDPQQNARRQERLLSDTVVNTYPTKVVEIAPVDKNKKYTGQFDTYIYDSLIYGIASGDYAPSVELPSRTNQEVVLMSAKDILLLFNYCMIRSMGGTPDQIPTVHKSALALKPQPVNIRQTYKLDGFPVNVNSYVNLYDYTNGYFQMNYNYTDPIQFSNELLSGFQTLMQMVSLQRINGDDRVGRMQRLVAKNMLIIGDVDLNLTTATNYQEWLTMHPDLKSLILDPIESNAKEASGSYQDLCSDLVDTLVPILPGFNQYGDFQVTDSSYQRIKQLFIQLTSYNITFVDDNTNSPEYLFLPPMWSSIWDEVTNGDDFYDQFNGDIHVDDYMADKIIEVIFDKLVEITPDTLTEPLGHLDVNGDGGEIVKEVSSDYFYEETDYNLSIHEKGGKESAVIIRSPSVGATLTLPDGPVPLSK